jgi:hypothetical protein
LIFDEKAADSERLAAVKFMSKKRNVTVRIHAKTPAAFMNSFMIGMGFES